MHSDLPMQNIQTKITKNLKKASNINDKNISRHTNGIQRKWTIEGEEKLQFVKFSHFDKETKRGTVFIKKIVRHYYFSK